MSSAEREDSLVVPEHHEMPAENPANDNEEDYTLSNGVVVKAIRHQHIRGELLQAAEASCEWTHPQPQGEAPNDRTAPVDYPEDQKHASGTLQRSPTRLLIEPTDTVPTHPAVWGWTRTTYPPINFVLEKLNWKHFDYDIKTWYHKGKLVLDLDGKPMKKFPHLPGVCSSKIPGGHIEALMRFDDRTIYADIRGRMPPTRKVKIKGKLTDRVQIGSNALSASAKEFRETTGMLSWKVRAGVDAFNDYIRANLPEDLKARNTTRGWRDITKAEIMTIREPTIGTRPEQARKRSSPDEAREVREKNIKRRKAAASAEREKAAAINGSEDDLTAHSSSDEEKEASQSEESAEESGPDVFGVPGDIRLQIPTTLEGNIAIRDALDGTIDQAASILGGFFSPNLEEPRSYSFQIEEIQKQFNAKYDMLYPGQEKPPTLFHLTPWSGGIENWRSATYWDGSSDYLIEDDGSIGERRLRQMRPEDTLKEYSAGAYLVDAQGNRIEAQPSSDGSSEQATAGATS
ncbi:MAG: hypothetical protein Q9169_003420 [Polycauliona sp. 2 TL-2023]